jgi:hypothetical protein
MTEIFKNEVYGLVIWILGHWKLFGICDLIIGICV